MTLTLVFIVSRDTLLAAAEVDMRSWRKVIKSSMLAVSNRAKLSKPPGSGAGRDDRLNRGCDLIPEDAVRGTGTDTSLVSTPGVKAPLTVGRLHSGGEGSKGACEWELREGDSGESSEEEDEDAEGGS
jgi:hypothetical protein